MPRIDRHLSTGRRKKSARRSGATALEFAIVAPLMIMTLLGIVELGRGLMVEHLLTNAARQGCRAGIIEGTANTDICNAVAGTLTPLGLGSDMITVQVNDGTADASTIAAGGELTVKVTVPVQSVTWVPVSKFLSGNLSGQYTLRRE